MSRVGSIEAGVGKAISTTDIFGVDSSETSLRLNRSIGSDSLFVRGLLRESFAMVGVLIGGGCPNL